MAINDIVQTVADARVDARSLSEFVYKPADFMVTRRLALPVHTLNYYLEWLDDVLASTGFVIQGSFADGATLSSPNDVVQASDGKLYRWGGALPKTVASGSTPQSTGGFGSTAWIEVSDAALRADLKKADGAGLVSVNIDGTYQSGTVGAAVARKIVSSKPLLPELNSKHASGDYLVVSAPDVPNGNGTAIVNVYEVGGQIYGSCEYTTYNLPINKKYIIECISSNWGEWREVVVDGDEIVRVTDSKKFAVGKGGYSWWNEPQSCQIGGVFRKTVVGAVDAVSGWTKSIIIDTSTNTVPITTANLKNRTGYVPDEHNAPVTIEADNTIITFYAGHDDAAYLPYRVAPNNDPTALGKEQRITGSFTKVSYAQAYYSQTPSDRKVFVFFRTDGVNGNGRSWSLATSTDWDTNAPTWEVNELFTDTHLMYLRVVPSVSTGVFRFLLTRNATYDNGENGIWFAYLNTATGGISTASSVSVGTLGGDAVPMTSLAKIYDAPNRIRLYDAQSHTNKIPMLLQKFTTQDDGDYRYVEFAIGGSWEITKDVPIAHSGKGLDNSSYYGGAHFSNIVPLKAGNNPAIDAVYVARNDSSGQWLLEEYSSSDSGSSWALKRVIDSSKTEKIWRPRVPFDTSFNPVEGQVVLTWCKGRWTTYRDYDSTIWALRS